LMAADILMYKPTKIPVGQDQTQHVELARDAAKFFNNKFGEIFPEPKQLYTDVPKIMSLLEPTKKMAKSLGDNHCIYLEDEPEIINKKISKAVTDSGDGKGLGAKNLLDLSRIFSRQEIYNSFITDGKQGKLKYSELKQQLGADISNYFKKFRDQKKKINDKEVEKILAKGANKAKKVATKTMEEVRKKIGIR